MMKKILASQQLSTGIPLFVLCAVGLPLWGCSPSEEPASAAAGTQTQAQTDSLIAALREKEPKTRVQAATALGELQDAKAVDPLITALHDSSLQVRWKAAWALGKIKDPRAIPPLLTVLKDKEAQMQDEAAWALGAIGTPAVEPLTTALQETDPHIRKAAASALAHVEDARATETLLTALRKKQVDIVAGAYTLFIRRGEPDTEDVLIDALEAHGDQAMAADFLSSGNSALEEAAREWGPRHGHGMLPNTQTGPRWGEKP